MDGKAILNLPMEANDADASTIRAYLKALLCRLTDEGESFSGKRPFGNSGWEFDLYTPLIKAGLVKGDIENGEVDELTKAQTLIQDAIAAL